jgi:hypothetical protein
MNAKQSLKLAEKRINDLEIVMARAQRDIKKYNQVIIGMINGDSPCQYCEEQAECQLQAKASGKGCPEWWLAYDPDGQQTEGSDDDGKNVLSADSFS